MIIEYTKDTNKRCCAICKRRIAKGRIIVKYEHVIDEFRNSRMWFAHIDCIIRKLKTSKKRLEKEMAKIPTSYVEIERWEE